MNLIRLAAVMVLLAVSVIAQASTSPTRAATQVPGLGSVDRPSFLIGASYQGPADRAWRGEYWAWWADDRFDAGLVDADFERA